MRDYTDRRVTPPKRVTSPIWGPPLPRKQALKVSTEFDCGRISVIVHHSASDKLAVAHSSCLFGAESYSGQRERKSVWQGFQYKSKICELVSGKLSKCLYIHSETHLITSSALNECLLVHNFQNNCSTECHCVTQKSAEV